MTFQRRVKSSWLRAQSRLRDKTIRVRGCPPTERVAFRYFFCRGVDQIRTADKGRTNRRTRVIIKWNAVSIICACLPHPEDLLGWSPYVRPGYILHVVLSLINIPTPNEVINKVPRYLTQLEPDPGTELLRARYTLGSFRAFIFACAVIGISTINQVRHLIPKKKKKILTNSSTKQRCTFE